MTEKSADQNHSNHIRERDKGVRAKQANTISTDRSEGNDIGDNVKNANKRLDKNTVIFNTSEYFKTPKDLLHDEILLPRKEDKIKALITWKTDIELTRVAEEENMRPLIHRGKTEMKFEEEIINALEQLNERPTATGTKLGSI